MAPAMTLASAEYDSNDQFRSLYHKGIKHLCDTGITKVPNKYVLPTSDRPGIRQNPSKIPVGGVSLQLPVVDFAQLHGPNRSHVLDSLAQACEEYGFFQVINHGIPDNIINNMMGAAKEFFELPFEERRKYMSNNMSAPVRYGTSYNQNVDGVFCWRDFLKLMCQPDAIQHWPSVPVDFTEQVGLYSRQTKHLYLMVMEAVLESLGVIQDSDADAHKEALLQEFEDGSQMMVVNCYPACPEPDLTLGMPPHSDYGFLTLLLQDDVKGLEIQHKGEWLTVEPIPNSFVVNVGDHLEIFSNGKYKSVLHRVLVNSLNSRISVASLHSLPLDRTVGPSPKLITEANPRQYNDTDFASFIRYLSSSDSTSKNFLESRKLK